MSYLTLLLVILFVPLLLYIVVRMFRIHEKVSTRTFLSDYWEDGEITLSKDRRIRYDVQIFRYDARYDIWRRVFVDFECSDDMKSITIHHWEPFDGKVIW